MQEKKELNIKFKIAINIINIINNINSSIFFIN